MKLTIIDRFQVKNLSVVVVDSFDSIFVFEGLKSVVDETGKSYSVEEISFPRMVGTTNVNQIAYIGLSEPFIGKQIEIA